MLDDYGELARFVDGDAALAALREEAGQRLIGDPGHDVAHCLRVALWTIRLGGAAVSPRSAIAAALLHDIVNLPKDAAERSLASERSAAFARARLPELGFEPADAEEIATAIHDHAYSAGRVPRTALGEALQDADRLEALGALGIFRTASCGARLGADYFDAGDPWADRRELDDVAHTVDHFFKKLLALPETLRTELGRAEARRRAAFMTAFLRQLGSEIGSPPPEAKLAASGASSPATEQGLVYERNAEGYERLVSAEDAASNLLPAIERIVKLDGAHVLEVGVGTGRIARQLLARGARVTGFDRAEPMLAVARRELAAVSSAGWELGCADARRLPVASQAFDASIAGWVFGHLRHWMPDGWRVAVGAALGEMERATKPGGALIIIETLGTGTAEPAAPNADLAEYYAWLEKERRLSRAVIRTDYAFADVDAAAEATGAFFGAEFARRVRREGRSRIPECTGIWWKLVDGYEGGCFCGRVRYRIGALSDSGYCHCSICRRISGGPVLTWVNAPRSTFSLLEGTPAFVSTSEHFERAFCPACGTHLFTRSKVPEGWPYVSVNQGTLDRASDIQPKVHLCHRDRLPWLEITDALPRVDGSVLPPPEQR